jgi:hypothetical protein
MAVSYIKIANYTEMSTADSALQSSIDAGGGSVDSIARSKAESAQAYADSAADSAAAAAGGGGSSWLTAQIFS